MPQTISTWVGIGLFLISLLPLINFLQPGLPVTHDGQDHVARIANFYQSLSEGNMVPRWSENLNWGYGHPVTMFLYPLPSYIASMFHMLGFSFIDSTKLVFAVAFSASILTMYLWAGSVWGKYAGITAAVLYGFAPYRFVDMYARGAIGEHVAFIFLPLVLWGIYTVSPIPIAFGTAALILSHNAFSVMFIPIILLYAVYVSYSRKKYIWNFLLRYSIYIGVGFLLAAFFWIPAFFEGKYTLRDIVTAGDFAKRFVPPFSFLWPSWNFGGGNEFSKFLGFAQWNAIIMVIWIYKKLSKQDKRITVFIFALLFLSFFLMTEFSVRIWQHITFIQKFQFPWRLLSVSVFLTSTIGALAVVGSGSKRHITACILGIMTIISTYPMWHAQTYKRYPESFFTTVYAGTTDTGESSPIWSIRFMEQRSAAPIEIISGIGKIEIYNRVSTSHQYKVFAETEISLVENTLYFPGWNVYVDGEITPVEFQNPNHRGLMIFTVPAGSHVVNIVFGKTKVRTIADGISWASGVFFVIFLGTMYLWPHKKRRSASL